ncbi:hypothetical protein JOB18_026242 [Solea senegalensis]|uniref:Uncharacterized protein n=1 Tax=Solea senegalensis TaxID=28829 RepID=A0AAV6T7P8_SOLSE|nr:hypothetical protein JOB18_026242 [Solea senegalensis]
MNLLLLLEEVSHLFPSSSTEHDRRGDSAQLCPHSSSTRKRDTVEFCNKRDEAAEGQTTTTRSVSKSVVCHIFIILVLKDARCSATLQL